MSNTGWPIAAPVAEATIGHNSGEVEVAPVPTYEVKHKSQPETEKPEDFRLRRNAEIDFWLNSKQTAVAAVDLEKSHRAKVTATLFPTPTKGTQRYDLGGGYKVKLVATFTYKLGDKDKVDEESGAKISINKQVEDLEDRVEKMGPAHMQVLSGLISWKPEISGSAWEKLNDDDQVQLDVKLAVSELLTISPGSPQLTFEEPKAST